MVLHQLLCDADDFCIDFLPLWHSPLLGNGDKKRLKNKCLSESEITTIVVCFQLGGFRVFKWPHQRHVAVYKRVEFPNLPSYNRFVELTAQSLEPPAAFMQGRCGKSRGIAFVDSTSPCVCENIRIPRHRTFVRTGRACKAIHWLVL